MQNFWASLSPTAKKVLGLVGLGAILLVAVLLLHTGGKEQAEIGDGTFPDQTRILNGRELYDALNNPTEYIGVSQDLKTFQASGVNAKKEASFTITGKPKKKDKTITFSGKYEDSGDKIVITVTPLANDRIKTSITNTKNHANIDPSLPSANKKNKLILSLPVVTSSYGIYYYRDTKKITIELYSVFDPDNRETALNALRDGIDKTSLNTDDYDLYYSDANTGGSNAMIQDTSYNQ